MKCILSPGEQVYYNRTTHNLEKKNFILSDYSSWKDGKYYFKNETLENIAKQLERNFDVNIIIKNDSLRHCREMQERHNPIFIMLRLYGIRTKHICQLPEYNSRKSFGNSSESRRVFFLCQNKWCKLTTKSQCRFAKPTYRKGLGNHIPKQTAF